jgi:hypothetical protein
MPALCYLGTPHHVRLVSPRSGPRCHYLQAERGALSYALLIEGKGSGMSLIPNLVIIWRLRASGSMGRFSSNRDAKRFDLLKSHCLRNSQRPVSGSYALLAILPEG